ncbi:MAG TPA: Nif3-like dinuclear metal center hexameric protein, partial [Bdellovibrionota bacterium]|nr:Nif3-like dinuclear metal center hexameric protein [Bdellovibrionota bacterium]
MAKKAIQIGEVMAELERQAPAATAESWDNVGLLAGDPAWTTTGAVVTIDLTRSALEAARKSGAGLIVTHHPSIFPRGRGLSRIVPGADGSLSRLLLEALAAKIAIAACHTNFDRCALEVVQAVSSGLGVTPKGRLIEEPGGSLRKLVVYVPEQHVEAVREAICQAGAGHIGRYDECSFGTPGEGTFRGGSGTKPFVGQPGKLEKALEVRLETVF